jgi:hypothetical protein
LVDPDLLRAPQLLGHGDGARRWLGGGGPWLLGHGDGARRLTSSDGQVALQLLGLVCRALRTWLLLDRLDRRDELGLVGAPLLSAPLGQVRLWVSA